MCVFQGKFHAENTISAFRKSCLNRSKKMSLFKFLCFIVLWLAQNQNRRHFCLSFIVVDFPYFKPRQNR